MISLYKLTKYYNKDARGIIDVSLGIKEGEVFGFIGPNGAGKSTTVRTLLNLIFPTSGNASVMNLDIVKDTVEIRKNVGYIASEINYYGDMTVRNFLEYSAKFYEVEYEERLVYLAEKLELDLTRKIEDLSFGNKKKVAIVQAFMHQPKVLILDEPTSGLDPLMQTIFFELLEEERKRGATIFFSSHILGEVQRICDRVGIIKEGQLVKIEKIEDLMNNQAKNIRLVTNEALNLNNADIVNMKKVGNVITFTYTGKINELLSLLMGVNVIDLTISEPTLEEIFMHYYEREEK